MSDNLKVKHMLEIIKTFQDKIVGGSILDPSNSFLAFVVEDENESANVLCEVDEFDLYEPDVQVLKIQGKDYNRLGIQTYKMPTILDFIEMVERHNLYEYEICLEDHTDDNIIRHHVKDKGHTVMSRIGDYTYIIFRPKPKEYTEKELPKNILQELGGITS